MSMLFCQFVSALVGLMQVSEYFPQCSTCMNKQYSDTPNGFLTQNISYSKGIFPTKKERLS